jgi:hypothetical protein
LICALDGAILRSIIPPIDRIWADPFPIEYDGKTYIFIEQQIGFGNGTLGFIELYADLSYSDFIPILEKPYHLSFPNVFPITRDKQTTWYMIPETAHNKTIDLYRAEHFPDKWVFELNLMKEVKAVDSVVFFLTPSGGFSPVSGIKMKLQMIMYPFFTLKPSLPLIGRPTRKIR